MEGCCIAEMLDAQNLQYEELVDPAWTLRRDESDCKIFFILKRMPEMKKVLIISQDSDVKMLAIYWQSCFTDKISYI